MWQFGFPTLAWGLLLVLVPLAIHLIQLLRHRRVRWAAMDFLLQSYKRHRKWVWLRQFLLLVSRMAAIALLVLILAQWKPQSRLLGRWGGASVHHYVLLDDSVSMGEQSAGGVSTFDVALAAVGRLLEQLREQETSQRVTLIRFSRAEAAFAQEVSADAGTQLADLNSQPIDALVDKLWEETRRQLAVSQRASTAVAALKLVQQLVQDEDQTTSKMVHLVSDFRRVPWENPADLRAALVEVQAAGARLEFIHCARRSQPNLAITRVEPEPGPRAEGVPLYVTVEVTNFSDQVARNIQLKVRTWYFDPEKNAQPGAEAVMEDLPVELIPTIAPRQAAVRRVQVFFPRAGAHVVEATLPEDALPTDNRRWCVLDIRAAEPVLVVDGDAEQRNAFYLESIFQPGPAARTGIQPVPKDLGYLRDVSPEELTRYSAIYLLDVPRLDSRAVENIERFVADGGGLAVFLGPRVDRRFYNDVLYRGGEGVFPLPLEQQDLMPPEETGEPDVNVDATEHPVFRDLLAGRNPLVRLIHVDRYFSPPSDWRPPSDSTVRVVAALRNGPPFLVERSWGNGRVMVCTSTYAPLWNDMVLGPNAILALQLQAYLAQGRRRFPEQRVGEAWSWELNLADYLPDVKLVLPDSSGNPRRVVDHSLAAATDGGAGRVVLGDASSVADSNGAGIYEMWSYRVDGQADVRRRAVNVDTRESDLALVDMPWLVDQLSPARVAWRYADQGPLEAYLPANLPPHVLLLILLVSLLLAEQALGYAASYHPPQGARL